MYNHEFKIRKEKIMVSFVFLLIYFIVIIVGSKISEDKQLRENAALMEREGYFRETNRSRYFELDLGYRNNWNEGDKSLFPEEYLEFFEADSYVLDKWIIAKVEQVQIDEGLRPWICSKLPFNAQTAQPLRDWEDRFSERYKQFLQNQN